MAMENISDDFFDTYLFYRTQINSLLQEFVSLGMDAKVTELAVLLCEYQDDDEVIKYIEDIAYNIAQYINRIKINFERYNELNKENDSKLREKFVIMGWTGTGTTDIGANPFHEKYINVGTHGVVLDTILSESFIIPLGIWWRILFMLIFIPLFFIATSRLSPVIRAFSGFAATLIIFFGAIFLFRLTGVYWGPLGAVLSMLGATIAREIIAYAGSEKEKQFIRSAFSTYVSHKVVDEIIADPSRLQLGGANRYMTAIFTDVRGFSTIAEKLHPEELVSLLNRYLTAMSNIILEEKGTVDKYEGDAIIAFFGAPLELPDHALRACITAIRMKKIEEELNQTFIEQKMTPFPLLTRIGINTGDMVAGNMGSENKMDYTIMGNAVNLTARLEGINKQYGTWILSSENTVLETGSHLLYRKLDRVRAVGINEPVRLCELLDLADQANDKDRKLVTVFHEALDNFEKRQWKSAAEGFMEAVAINRKDDALSKLYLERSEEFIKTPPADEWDGVYNLTSK
ncbi:MAG: adenylate/guanylate cyclase domain-containing protein, partial [Treponema sp.]|jgi:adenylate cyclase|nr:adenylate/guanylate cyclase domain-containing protein [Treponema sp.]